MFHKSLFALILAFSTGVLSYAQSPKGEAEEHRRERLQMAVQAICPMSGESITSNATPIKWMNRDTKEVLYVCCENCLKTSPNAEHLRKIRNNFAKAQGHCLVMAENEISDASKHGIVEGHFIYVCCPPCVKKMTADPSKFLSALADLYEAYLKK